MIGYYVHHHGRGHLTRALAISRHLTDDVVFFSSAPRPAAIRPGDDWVQLPSDVPPTGQAAVDATANGRLHWAPVGVDGLAERSAMLLDAIVELRPRRMVVDVSVEVTMLVRLAGVPVTVMAMPGDRTDQAHRLAYDVADRIVAPWSADVYRPAWLRRYDERTHYVGSISRFDGTPLRPGPRSTAATGLLLAGAGGSEAPRDAAAELTRAAPGLRWVAAGGGADWVDDLWPLLSAAEVVITHAGQNAIADVAMAKACAVVIPEQRPFGEQHATAAALAEAGIAVSVPRWPSADRWAALVERARHQDPRQWNRLRVEGAAARAAAAVVA
ncbi:glycosyltransferase [Mycobacterium sp. NPDC050041]|uniref:glycosyltransferase n=1 Tax=Mycobacterium sp. NPDC050041 TaxID=3364293 RepID=UPI003C2C37D4